MRAESVAQSFALRGKVWRWSEWYSLFTKLPTDSITEFDGVDPFVYLTHSYKNYSSFAHNKLHELYLNSNYFNLIKVPEGVGPKISYIKSTPVILNYVLNNRSFVNEDYIHSKSRWLYCVPGVRRVYIIGSTRMGLAHQNGDIDLAIQCSAFLPWITRLIIKLFLKVRNQDVHLFLSDTAKQIVTLLGLKRVANAFSNRQWQHKVRNGFKLDCGMFFVEDADVAKFCPQEPRLWSFHNRSMVARPNESINTYFGSNLVTHHAASCDISYSLGIVKYTILKITIHIISILFIWLIIPVSFIQYSVHKIKNSNNPNFKILANFICFYPLIYKDGYWTSI